MDLLRNVQDMRLKVLLLEGLDHVPPCRVCLPTPYPCDHACFRRFLEHQISLDYLT